MREQEIVKGLLPEMAQIINAIPGEVYTSKDAETLLIMQRRLSDCDLKRELTKFNSIFAKQKGAAISDITDSAVSYIKIKVLSESELSDFDAKSLREFIKECRLYIDRTTNIIRLSKTHVMTADAYQKEKIEQTIRKNEAFIEAVQIEIAEVEKCIERIPKSIFETEEEPCEEPDTLDESIVSMPNEYSKKKVDIVERIGKMISARKEKKEIEDRLKDAEKEVSTTKCLEIPFYDRSLEATQVLPCKDLSCYVLLKRKENMYFGLCKNLKGNVYDNSDQSLIELTEVSEEFIQFMTNDILSDEYELRAFTKAEKEGMQMYFNFVSKCFENYIGNTLTVTEYINFKRYYNRLVSVVLALEETKKHSYYRALPIAEKYMVLMESYNMAQSQSKKEIIEAIIDMQSEMYVENMKLIIEHHIVDEVAKSEINHLIEMMDHFSDENYFAEKEKQDKTEIKVSSYPTKECVSPMGFFPQIPVIQPAMMPVIGNMYFTLQCLDENREIVDEAHFATRNMTQAMQDYNSRKAYIKRFGLVQDGKFLPLMSSEKGEI